MNKKAKVSNNKFKEIWSILTNKKVIISIVVTLILLILFRIGAIIPMPYVKINASLNSGTTFLDMMNLLGGGGLTNVSIFAIGISPYITAQIILQLLSTDLVPPLARLAKSGERGRKKIEIYTRILALPLACIQAFAILETLSRGGDNSYISFSSNMTFAKNSAEYYFFFISLMVAGTYISIFLADLITKRGVGNGMTLIILAGIVGSFFNSFQTVFNNLQNIGGAYKSIIQIISFIVYMILYVILLLAVVFINGSIRKIPIQQVGQSLSKDPKDLSYLPIKINSVGVMPVIFASSLMTIPSTIAQFLDPSSRSVYVINEFFSLNGIVGIFIYFMFIMLFTFFYSYIQLNPEKISNDFKKTGRFVVGIKMGIDTEKHISKVIYRINWIGGPFLGFIAILPYLISVITLKASGGTINIPTSAALGGTGIIIMVTGSLEVWSSIKSTATTTNYQYKRKEIEQIILDKGETTTKDVDKANEDSQLW